MPVTRPLLAACVLVALGYIAYPYVTLYRLGEAVHSGDAGTLKALVNWPAVRQGIKHDIDKSHQADAKNELPGFGSAFVRGIATHAVDTQVTPQGLVAAVRGPASSHAEHDAMQVNWAFFDSPTQFQVSLRAPGEAQPIRLLLGLHDNGWQVDRVWLPRRLLDRANART